MKSIAYAILAVGFAAASVYSSVNGASVPAGVYFVWSVVALVMVAEQPRS